MMMMDGEIMAGTHEIPSVVLGDPRRPLLHRRFLRLLQGYFLNRNTYSLERRRWIEAIELFPYTQKDIEPSYFVGSNNH
jgi:hypothetical protein